jgi:hypothetical protein
MSPDEFLGSAFRVIGAGDHGVSNYREVIGNVDFDAAPRHTYVVPATKAALTVTVDTRALPADGTKSRITVSDALTGSQCTSMGGQLTTCKWSLPVGATLRLTTSFGSNWNWTTWGDGVCYHANSSSGTAQQCTWTVKDEAKLAVSGGYVF